MGRGSVKNRAVFLDRDGTIIYDRNYLSSPTQVKLYAYSAECVKTLQKAGFKVIIITNQSGIGRGKFTLKKLNEIHSRFFELLKEQGAKLDGLYFCPHIDEDNCPCRKPKLGMVLEAAKDKNLDLKSSYVVGDSIRDYIVGQKMGGKGILTLTGHGKKQEKSVKNQTIKPFAVCANLKSAVKIILNDSRPLKKAPKQQCCIIKPAREVA
ncbi:MAG: HAD family hydrolase [Elusimicrobiota bacterium]|nr:HAD family hydrolase [Elusimicrobiota bacterium]